MISDFGLSKTEEDGSMMATACGTPGYVGRSRKWSRNRLWQQLSCTSRKEVRLRILLNGTCRTFICVEVVLFIFFFFGTKLETKPTLSWLLGLPKKTRQFLPLAMAVFFPELFEVFFKIDYEWSRETRDWTEYIHTRETRRPRNAWLLPEIMVAPTRCVAFDSQGCILLAHSSLAKIRGYFHCGICLFHFRCLFNQPYEFFLAFFFFSISSPWGS